MKERAEARNWLADRFWGKAPAQVDINVNRSDTVRVALGALSDDELDRYIEIERKIASATGATASAAIVDAEVVSDGGASPEPT